MVCGASDLPGLNWSAGEIPVAYVDGDAVTFDDTASGPFPIIVTVTNTVRPSSMIVSAANSYTIAGPGVIAGGEGLTKSGNGTLTLSGTNTYSGGTTISAGGGTIAVNYGGDGINNSAIGTGPLTLNTGAQLDNTSGHAITLLTPITQNWNDGWTFVGTANLNLGTAPITLGDPSPLNLAVTLTVASNVLEVDGQISDSAGGPGVLQKQGAGTLTLSNYNTFSGGLNIGAGTVNINTAGAVGSGPLTLNAAGTIDNTSGAPITLNSGPSVINFNGITFLGTADLDLGSAQLNVGGTGTPLVVMNNTLTVEGYLNGASSSITKTGAGALTIAGSQDSGSVGFTINGGTINLDRESSYYAIWTQPVTVNTNGTLMILNPTGSQFDQSTITLGGGLVEWNGDNETLASVNFNSGILRDSNPTTASLSLTAGGLLTLGGVADFDITNGATLTINGTIAETGSTNNLMLKTGAGTLIFATNTTYIANTTVSGGVLSLGYPTLSTNSTVTIAAGAKLDLNFTNTVSTTNIVAALVLNGVNAAAGLHNAGTDPAYITSGGSLLVIPAALPINPNPGTIQFSVSGGNTLNLAWPTNAGWLLQAQTNAFPKGLGTNWVTVPGSDAITNLSVTVNPTNGSTFYRMVLP